MAMARNQIPFGIMSSIKCSRFGCAIPLNCLWHSQRSKNKPNGMSQNSSRERRSCTVPK